MCGLSSFVQSWAGLWQRTCTVKETSPTIRTNDALSPIVASYTWPWHVSSMGICAEHLERNDRLPCLASTFLPMHSLPFFLSLIQICVEAERPQQWETVDRRAYKPHLVTRSYDDATAAVGTWAQHISISPQRLDTNLNVLLWSNASRQMRDIYQKAALKHRRGKLIVQNITVSRYEHGLALG